MPQCVLNSVQVNGTASLPSHEKPGYVAGVSYETIFDTTDTTLPSRRFSTSFQGKANRLFRELNGIELCQARCAEMMSCLGVFIYVAESAGGISVCDGLSSLGVREGLATSLADSQSYLKRRTGSFSRTSQILGIIRVIPTGVAFPLPSILTAMAAGDFDNDGALDLVTGFLQIGPGSANVLVFPQSRFGRGDTTIVASNINCIEILAADVNMDGFDDLVIADFDTIYVLTNNQVSGTSSFTTVKLTGISNLQKLALRDLDADGDLDLFAMSAIDSSLAIFDNSNGSFMLLQKLTFGDFGLIKDMVLHTGGNHSSTLLLANSSTVSRFSLTRSSAGIEMQPLGTAYHVPAKAIQQVAIGRLEHPSTQDLAVIRSDGSVVIVPHFDPKLAFSVRTNITGSIVTFAATELTGDNLDDLVVAGKTQDNTGVVFVYRNKGANLGERFETAYRQIYQANDVIQVLLEDFSGDGRKDLVAASTQKYIEYRINSKQSAATVRVLMP